MNEKLIWMMKSVPILVVGDVMVDEYIVGEVDRISPEAPVPVLLARDRLRRLGGAGNVVGNLVSLGASVALSATVGNDNAGRWFRNHCEAAGVETFWLKEHSTRPTTIKTRVVARNQQLVRIDEEYVADIGADMETAVAEELKSLVAQVQAVVVSDYGKGFLTRRILRDLFAAAAENDCPVLVDPKGRDYTRYRGATYITPNVREASLASGVEITDQPSLEDACAKLLEQSDSQGLILTRGREGITLVTRRDVRDFPVKPVEIIDVTGAGDTVIATLAVALANNLAIGDAIRCANIAASLVVSRFGAASVTLQEMADSLKDQSRETKIVGIDEIADVTSNHRIRGRKIVFTNGCFDLLHAGHVETIRQAAAVGDILVVGINSDRSVARIKGNGRPIMPEKQRMELVAALRCVDYVVLFEEDTPLRLIELVSPDILVKGEDWKGKEVVGSDVVLARGGRVEYARIVAGLSTTDIIAKIREQS